MLTKKYNKKMNKTNKGITEVRIASLILFNLSFEHVTLAFEFLPELDDGSSAFRYYQT